MPNPTYGLPTGPNNLVPPGDPIGQNIVFINDWLRAHPSATNDERLAFFYEMVRSNIDNHLPIGLSWDYKRDRAEYQDFGNFNYGVVGVYLGLSDDAILWGAGIAQGVNNGFTRSLNTASSLLSGARGDNPEDQALILQGIAYGRALASATPPAQMLSTIDLTDSLLFASDTRLGLSRSAEAIRSELLVNYWAGRPDESLAETARLSALANSYWFEREGVSPTGERLGNVSIASTLNTVTQTIWTRDITTGDYTKTEGVTVQDSNGSIVSQTLTIYQYSAGGSATDAVSYVYDHNGNLVRSVNLSPNANGSSWIATGNGAQRASSSTFITVADATSVVVNPGGTLSDIVFLQNRAGNPVTLRDILASNPNIINEHQISSGQVVQIPSRVGDTLTLRYSNGAVVVNNPTTGEYSMIVPNSDGLGGVTIYERRVDGDAGFAVRQVITNVSGDIVFQSNGFQADRDSTVVPHGVTAALPNGTYETSANVGGITVNFEVQRNGTQFEVTDIKAVGGQPVDSASYGIDPQDLEAYGFTFDRLSTGTVPVAGAAIAAALGGSLQPNSREPFPQAIERDLGNGLTARTVELGNGLSLSTIRNTAGQVVEFREQEPSGDSIVTRSYDPGRQLQSTTNQRTYIDGTSVRDVSFVDGSSTHTVYGLDGRPTSVTGNAAPLQSFGTAIQDLNSLVGAIKSGQPLPILNSGLTLIDNQVNPTISGTQTFNNMPLYTTTAVVSAVSSLYSLHQAFSGDGTDVQRFTATAYAVVAVNSAANAVASQISGTVVNNVTGAVVGGVANTLAEALPYVNIALSLQNGDYTGVAVGIASAMNVPYIGWVYAAYLLIDSLANEPPEAWATGHFRFATTNDVANAGDMQAGSVPAIVRVVAPGTSQLDPLNVQADIVGDAFGPDRVRLLLQGNGSAPGSQNYFGGVLGYLNEIIDQQTQAAPDRPLGIIPQRLPTLSWHEARQNDPGYSITDIDPLTGTERLPQLRYNDDWTPYNADPTDPEQRRNVFDRLITSAIDREAIAPLWEVQTARLQQDNGDPNAGLTEEVRAAHRNLLAPVDAATQQRSAGVFRPIALDLNGDGRVRANTTLACTTKLSRIDASNEASWRLLA
jgi:hypothetical protein